MLKKIEQIVREEQEKAGAIEMLMPTLQSADLWRHRDDTTLRPEICGVKDRHERVLYGRPTRNDHRDFAGEARSYRDLPRTLYHSSGSSVTRCVAVRRDSRARVFDEGRLHFDLTRRERATASILICWLSADVSAAGIQAVPSEAASGTMASI